MTNNDSGFVGSIPDLYDSNVGPLMTVPYAGHIAARLSYMTTGRLLEVAAGTGIVSTALALALPRAQLIACAFSKPHPRLLIGMEVVLEVEGSQFDTTAGPSHR